MPVKTINFPLPGIATSLHLDVIPVLQDLTMAASSDGDNEKRGEGGSEKKQEHNREKIKRNRFYIFSSSSYENTQ